MANEDKYKEQILVMSKWLPAVLDAVENDEDKAAKAMWVFLKGAAAGHEYEKTGIGEIDAAVAMLKFQLKEMQNHSKELDSAKVQDVIKTFSDFDSRVYQIKREAIEQGRKCTVAMIREALSKEGIFVNSDKDIYNCSGWKKIRQEEKEGKI